MAGILVPTASAAQSLTKIASSSFSNVASVTVDNCFSSTYLNYMMILNVYAATAGDDLHVQLRYGSTTKTTQYYTSAFAYGTGNSLSTFGNSSPSSQFFLTPTIGNAAQPSAYTIYLNKVGNTSENPNIWGQGIANAPDGGIVSFSGWNEGAQTYTGFVVKSSSSNITGKYQIYGLAN